MKKTILAFTLALSLISCSQYDSNSYTYAPVDDFSTQSDSGISYTVKKGDSLYYIAWHYGLDYKKLAEINKIKSPYSLTIGQKLSLLIPEKKVPNHSKEIKKNNQNFAVETSSNQIKAKSNNQATIKNKFVKSESKQVKYVNKDIKTNTKKQKIMQSNVNVKSEKNTSKWIWPVKPNKLRKDFFKGGAQRGVDIETAYQTKVKAAASGVVVYTGNGIKGLGNLVIIKHPHDFLTAYGYSNKVLVKEGQKIKSGQVIATVGHPPVGKDRLHFEMRKHGKSVNPVIYLPKFS